MSQKCLFIYVGQLDMSYTLAGKRDYTLKREPQIGFAYLSAVLRQHGVESEILDFTLKPHTKKSLVEYVDKESPIFVGFYAASAMKSNLLMYLKALRKRFPNLKILVGGPDIYDCESYLRAGADAYCIGEGERTIVDLLAYCQGRMDRSKIKGIAYKEGNRIRHTPLRDLIENLDELPIPAWDKYDLNKYYDYHVFDMEHPYTSIMASRGCLFQCTYCISHKIWRHRYRRRSPAHVMKEIDYLVFEHGVKYINFQDDIWGWMDDEWAKKLCKELISRKYKVKWRCQLHPLSFLKNRKEMLSLMKESGCSSIAIGLQSASKEILKNIQRGPNEPQVLAELVETAKEVGILNSTDFIFGLPGETKETIEESIRYALKIKPTFCGFYVLSMLPGSDIWLMEKQGKFHSLPDSFARKKCKEAAKRFYTNPGVAYNIFKSIMKSNPKWLLKVFGHLKYLLEISGIFRSKSAAKKESLNF